MIAGRAWTFWVFIALLIVVNFLLHLAIGLGATAPDLLTVAVLLAARRLRPAPAAALGLALGLLRDALSLIAFGADAVALTVLGFLGARSRDLFVGESLAFVALYLFVGKWLHDVIYYLIAGADVRGSAVVRLLIEAPLAAVYAAVAGTAALLLYRLVTGER
ncbi:MAG TPA: rod shape-determining protein MreD [Longimicrobiales bacterium]